MPSRIRTIHSRLRQDEYVGPNRCLPCTAVNLVIAGGVAGAFAVVTVSLGVTAFVVAVLAIYFRGYLVPGTPTLTQRYFPEQVLVLFGKQPTATDGAGATQTAAVGPSDETDEPAQQLVGAGVVEPCADVDDLCLAPSFRETWWRRIERFRDNERAKEQLAATIRVDPAALSFEEKSAGFVVGYQGDRIAQWSSKGAFLADLAADPTLGEWVSGWSELPDHARTEHLVRLRAMLERCPACDEQLEENVETMSSCCGSDIQSISLDCPECGSLFTGTDR
ncbi:hypothetical protein SAMN05216226_1026 [Halovenus aranensis]|uniref:Uncharacterized protein n=1 Tax=Halovenus aranensis TaxID=890420 RepID=A0A1G8SK52_9EURY|nr:hypothetical protein [Halovenus aranensis]SDJ29581.1 hypothetical protein SAMN05216226_1026 [Halovenus aranensis]